MAADAVYIEGTLLRVIEDDHARLFDRTRTRVSADLPGDLGAAWCELVEEELRKEVNLILEFEIQSYTLMATRTGVAISIALMLRVGATVKSKEQVRRLLNDHVFAKDRCGGVFSLEKFGDTPAFWLPSAQELRALTAKTIAEDNDWVRHGRLWSRLRGKLRNAAKERKKSTFIEWRWVRDAAAESLPDTDIVPPAVLMRQLYDALFEETDRGWHPLTLRWVEPSKDEPKRLPSICVSWDKEDAKATAN